MPTTEDTARLFARLSGPLSRGELPDFTAPYEFTVYVTSQGEEYTLPNEERDELISVRTIETIKTLKELGAEDFKKEFLGDYISFTGKLFNHRIRVTPLFVAPCERVEVGTETKTVYESIAVEKEVPVYEHNCPPVVLGVANALSV